VKVKTIQLEFLNVAVWGFKDAKDALDVKDVNFHIPVLNIIPIFKKENSIGVLFVSSVLFVEFLRVVGEYH